MEVRTLEHKRVEDLTPTENMELVTFAATSYFPLICKIMEYTIIEQRDEAMATDPSEEAKQRARMTEAHAMAKQYTRFRKMIDVARVEHMGAIAQTEVEKNLQDQAFIEELIINQS